MNKRITNFIQNEYEDRVRRLKFLEEYQPHNIDGIKLAKLDIEYLKIELKIRDKIENLLKIK